LPPEEFAVGSTKTWGAENIELLRLGCFRAQPVFDRRGLRRFEHRGGIGRQAGKNAAHGFWLVDTASFGKLGIEDRAAKIISPALVETDQRNPPRK
jgi:hypothetical protein